MSVIDSHSLCNCLSTLNSYLIYPHDTHFEIKNHYIITIIIIVVGKVARICCPVQVQQLKPDATALEEFSNFPIMNENTIANFSG